MNKIAPNSTEFLSTIKSLKGPLKVEVSSFEYSRVYAYLWSTKDENSGQEE